MEEARQRAGRQGEGETEEGEDLVAANEVRLEIGGDTGTEFSGTCAVGDDVDTIGGLVPQMFDYELDGRKLKCEIRKLDAGEGGVKVTLIAGRDNARSVQQISASGGAIKFSYSRNGISSSTYSGGQVRQVNTSSSSSSSSGASSWSYSSVSFR